MAEYARVNTVDEFIEKIAELDAEGYPEFSVKSVNEVDFYGKRGIYENNRIPVRTSYGLYSPVKSAWEGLMPLKIFVKEGVKS